MNNLIKSIRNNLCIKKHIRYLILTDTLPQNIVFLSILFLRDRRQPHLALKWVHDDVTYLFSCLKGQCR